MGEKEYLEVEVTHNQYSTNKYYASGYGYIFSLNSVGRDGWKLIGGSYDKLRFMRERTYGYSAREDIEYIEVEESDNQYTTNKYYASGYGYFYSLDTLGRDGWELACQVGNLLHFMRCKDNGHSYSLDTYSNDYGDSIEEYEDHDYDAENIVECVCPYCDADLTVRNCEDGARVECCVCGRTFILNIDNDEDDDLGDDVEVDEQREIICPSCGEMVTFDEDSINEGIVVCTACGEEIPALSMDCPSCGESFTYSGKDVEFGEVVCPSCGERCHPDIDDLRSLLPPLDLDDDDETNEEDEEIIEDEEQVEDTDCLDGENEYASKDEDFSIDDLFSKYLGKSID